MILASEAKFLSSAEHFKQAMPSDISEVAFIGRSNVGKSSLLNLLLGKNLAKSSSTPGKTRLINFFSLTFKEQDNPNLSLTLRFVDLPGFGYAKVSKEVKKQWESNIVEFLRARSSIKLFIFLRDSRHPHLAQDDEVLEFLHTLKRDDQEILTIYTKADKLNQKELVLLKGFLLTSTNVNKKIESKITSAQVLRKIIWQKVLGITEQAPTSHLTTKTPRTHTPPPTSSIRFNIERPSLSDIPQMRKLVQREVQKGIILERSEDEIANAIRSYHIIRVNGIKQAHTQQKNKNLKHNDIVGFCSLYIYSNTLGELRSLIVDENYRNLGIASALIDSIKNEGKMLGLREILVLTYKESLFKHKGFAIIDKAKLPNHKIWADCIKCKHFPICDEIALIARL